MCVPCVRQRELSCERQLKVVEEAALQGDSAPTIGIRALSIRGGDYGTGGYGGRRGGGGGNGCDGGDAVDSM